MLIKQVSKHQQLTEQLVQCFKHSVDDIIDNIDSPQTNIFESQENLKNVIKKILITNKEIPQHLATTIAKTIVYSSMLQHLIDLKKRYRKYTLLQKVYNRITDKTAQKLSPATTEEIDNVYVDILNVIDDTLSSIKAKRETQTDIEQTFDVIKRKMTTNTTERIRLDIMQLASKIIQSNNDIKKRREIIAQYLQ